jgi:hypothetical protein
MRNAKLKDDLSPFEAEKYTTILRKGLKKRRGGFRRGMWIHFTISKELSPSNSLGRRVRWGRISAEFS